MTLAFVPDGTEIPKPPSVDQLDQLTDVPTQPGATTTLPIEPGAPFETTATGDTAPATTAAPTTSAPAGSTTSGS